MSDEAYRLSVAAAARREPTEPPPVGSPLAAATAAAGFTTGPLLDSPRVVGRPLANELAGYHSARRGSYGVVYRIDESAGTVHLVRIDHCADVYRQ